MPLRFPKSVDIICFSPETAKNERIYNITFVLPNMYLWECAKDTT